MTATFADDNHEDEAASKLPVTLLTGFLGSGKTTCLNAFLDRPDVSGTAVIVNEFGAIDVDGAVLEGRLDGGGDLLRLPNGCICCEIQEDLAEGLLQIAARGGFGRCVIETTGLAEPGAILRGLHHDPRLRRVARAELVLTICAADRMAVQIGRYPETARQIAVADRILLTKTDLVSAAEVRAAEADIKAVNPLADWADPRNPAAAFRPAISARHRTVPQHSHAHSHGIASFWVALDGALDPDRFRDTMSFLILRHADRLLRAKGLIRFAGDDRAQLINIVHDVYDARPAEARNANGLVFIGQDLPESEIRADLQSCLQAARATA